MAEIRIVLSLSGLTDDEARERGDELSAQFRQLCLDDLRLSYRCDLTLDAGLRDRTKAAFEEADAVRFVRLFRQLLNPGSQR
jgi:hypothetical protein